MNNLQEQGRAHYKRGDYKKAVEFFDRAIGRAPSVQLLDNRAACYEKLNELSTALKDAKKAVQLHREDATGYLRAGKVLVKMEKPSVALEVFTHGLKSIKHIGQGYELLRKSHKELMDQLSPPKSVDPLTVLPRELAEHILEYLSFRQRMNACLVSKQWSQFIRSCPSLWRHLDLSAARIKVKSAFVSRTINIGRSRLTVATLRWLYDFDKTLQALVKHCPLEELTLIDCGLQSRNLIEALAPAKHLKQLKMGHGVLFPPADFRDLMLTISRNIESLECRLRTAGQGLPHCSGFICKKLRFFNVMIDNPHLAQLLLNGISERMPAIQSITVHQETSARMANPFNIDLEECAQLKSLDLAIRAPYASLLKLPADLVSLRLVAFSSGNVRNFFWDSSAGQMSTISLPCLEELSLDMPGMPVDHTVSVLAYRFDETGEATKAASKLRKLSIKSAVFAPGSIDQLLSHSRLDGLEKLSLPWLQDGSDQTVTEIITCLQNRKALHKLQSLDLSGTNVTGVGVKDIVQAGDLEELVLNDCRLLGTDAVDWARAQGIRVTYRMSDGGSGCKKVRY